MGEGTSTSLLGLGESTTPEQLAVILGTTYKKIKYFYYDGNISAFYDRFEIKKKSGGVREIFAPKNQLKALQGKLAGLLEGLYTPRSSAKAFIKGRSLYENACSHTRKKFVFNIDLENFFPTITFARVRGLLIAKPYGLMPETASVIAHLVTLRGFLPQGAPSSPLISNMICSRLDRQLSSLAREHRAAYTRYADDITFSFYCPLKYLPLEIVGLAGGPDRLNHYRAYPGHELRDIVGSNGFSINSQKVRLQSAHERQVVTGLVVNKVVNVDRRFVRKTSAMIHSIETYGLDRAIEINKERNPSEDPERGGEASFDLEPHVQGRLLFIKQIKGEDSPVYRKLAIRFNALSGGFKVPISSATNAKAEIFGGGVTEKCWVLEVDDTISQGTGFMLQDGLMITCAHVVAIKPNSPEHVEWCWAFLVSKKSEKHKAVVVHYDQHRDIAILRLDTDAKGGGFFRLEERLAAKQHDKVSIYGFPDYKPASTTVGCVWARITNSFVASAVAYFEVDKVLYSGNSGGPVLNVNRHVVGIAARGAVEGKELNAFICVSELKAVLQEYKNTLRAE